MNKAFYLILLFDGLIWLRSSFEKLTGGKFVDSLGATLTKLASQNPYPWYKSFLQNVAIPNAKTFGLLTMWGEFFTALAITLASLYFLTMPKKNQLVRTFLILGLFVGAFLNAVFWLASGWTSPSTDALNLLMLAVETIGLITVLKLPKSGKS